jgi:hypothetical protein
MIDRAIEQRGPLRDFVNDHPELEKLALSQERWTLIGDLRTLLQPFEDFTKFISRLEPTTSIAMSGELYMKLERQLRSIINREGEFALFDDSLIEAAKAGLSKLEEYSGYMKENNTY